MDPAQTHHVRSHGTPGAWDWTFLLLLVAALAGAAWVGLLAYREGVKEEHAKRMGEAWVQWLSSQAGKRADDGYGHAPCAARAGATWGGCREWLTRPEGPMTGQRNAFTGAAMRLVTVCDPRDRGTAGMVSLEKVTPLPAGMAVPFIVSPLTDADAIDQRLVIRVTACDKGSGSIRIGEPEF